MRRRRLDPRRVGLHLRLDPLGVSGRLYRRNLRLDLLHRLGRHPGSCEQRPEFFGLSFQGFQSLVKPLSPPVGARLIYFARNDLGGSSGITG